MAENVANGENENAYKDSLTEGAAFLKCGRFGAESEKMINFSGDLRYLMWTSRLFSRKFGRHNEIDMEKVIRIQHGQLTVPFQRFADKFQVVNQNSFSIIYLEDDVERSLDLIAPTPELFQLWFDGITIILNHIEHFRENSTLDERFLKAKFESADCDHNGSLSRTEIINIVSSMNANMPNKAINGMFDKVDLDKSDSLEFDEFCQFMTILRRRPELESIWWAACKVMADRKSGRILVPIPTAITNYQSGEQPDSSEMRAITMSNVQFKEFWNVVQPGDDSITQEGATSIIAEVMNGEDGDLLSYQGFRALITRKENDVYDSTKQKLYQDMNHPLSHYFIASSHNTYLEGDQLTSNSSVNRYVDDVLKGCRCVEIDCWDGKDGEPIVFHGHTLTGKVLFRDVISAVNKFGFEKSPFPIVLSIENHCGDEQQKKMADILKKTFGNSILMPSALMSNDAEPLLPSPAAAKNKIIIKGKRISAPSAEHHEHHEDDEDEEIPAPPSGAVLPPKPPAHPHHSTNQDLSDITYLATGKVKEFTAAESERIPADMMCSYSESLTVKHCKSKETISKWVMHNRKHLSRIYPKGTRVDSSNYDPAEAWSAGAQMVALNYQTMSLPMHLNDGKFRENGSCGYVLKPEYMLEEHKKPSGPCRLTLKVISGQQLPKPGGSQKGEIIDPYVVVTMSGMAADVKEYKTKTIDDNGFNPVWNETFTFDVSSPDAALLTLRCMDEDVDLDDFLAYATIPFSCLRSGWRTVALCSDRGKQDGDFDFARLFVHVTIENTI